MGFPPFPPQGVILNTTPHPVPPLQARSPPTNVVPYRLPCLSIIKFPSGYPPSAPPVKLYKMVSRPLGSNLNIVP